MNIPLSLSLALETPSYTQHQCQSQPLTAPVSSSPALAAPAESSPFYSFRRVNLCNTRPAQGQRQRQRQRRRQLSSQRPSNKVWVREEGQGGQTLLIFGPRRVSPVPSPAVEAAISISYLKRLRTRTTILRTCHRPP